MSEQTLSDVMTDFTVMIDNDGTVERKSVKILVVCKNNCMVIQHANHYMLTVVFLTVEGTLNFFK